MVFSALVVVAGIPARPDAATAAPAPNERGQLPKITILPSKDVAQLEGSKAVQIARDLVADLRDEADTLRRRDLDRAAEGATGEWLATLWEQIRDAEGRAIVVPTYDVRRMSLRLERAKGQAPPKVVAQLEGTLVVVTYGEVSLEVASRGSRESFRRTVELELERRRYRIARSRGGAPLAAGAPTRKRDGAHALAGISLEDVATQVGLDFRHGAFRFEMSDDETAMMGGGVCWLDYDSDGWLDLFAVNSYVDSDLLTWEAHGGLPRSALFRNVHGRFEDVSGRSGADLPLRGNGCVAADFDLDGHTDLYVTTAGYNVAVDGYDALLWNQGDGTFTEGARKAGINAPGWHAGAAVGDVNRDGRPDLVVTGYTDVNSPIPSSSGGFPTNHRGLRDFLYLNEGTDADGHSRFREVGRQAGLEATRVEHGLGAVLTDANLDGRLDLYIANDADPNRLYVNVPSPGGTSKDPAGLGFRFADVARREGVDNPNAGMGIAVGDFTLDGRPDLLVTNARDQLHAAFRSRSAPTAGRWFADARPALAAAFGTSSTGWGASWVDLDLDGDLDLAVANGGIPLVDLSRNAQRVQVLENLGRDRAGQRFASTAGLRNLRRVNGRGLAAADYDNDGDVDLAINSIGGRLMLLRNSGSTGHWLEVRLRTFSPGARVTVVLARGRRFVREVRAGSSYLSSEDPRVHFGLGDAPIVKELRIRFPDGTVTRRTNVPVDQVVVVGAASG
jgi:hypothetical protein